MPFVWTVSLNRRATPALSRSVPAVKADAARTLFTVNCSQIVWAVIFGLVVFGDMPSKATLAGAVINIGAGLYIFLRERKLGREDSAVNPPA